jgi:hypothetical protein
MICVCVGFLLLIRGCLPHCCCWFIIPGFRPQESDNITSSCSLKALTSHLLTTTHLLYFARRPSNLLLCHPLVSLRGRPASLPAPEK